MIRDVIGSDGAGMGGVKAPLPDHEKLVSTDIRVGAPIALGGR
jgi:hypothetical protein